MTPREIEAALRHRFMERCVSVRVSLEKLSRGEALAVRWLRDTRKDHGVIFMAKDAPLIEIVDDVETDLARKERGA